MAVNLNSQYLDLVQTDSSCTHHSDSADELFSGEFFTEALMPLFSFFFLNDRRERLSAVEEQACMITCYKIER